jgi:hypothetical protein
MYAIEFNRRTMRTIPIWNASRIAYIRHIQYNGMPGKNPHGIPDGAPGKNPHGMPWGMPGKNPHGWRNLIPWKNLHNLFT